VTDRRGRRPVRWAVMPALLAVLLVGRDAAAASTHVGGATWTPRTVEMTVALAGFRVPRDSVYVFLRLTWDKKGVRALREYERQGLRYTQELNDLASRVSGSGLWMSDLPGASFDLDDDDGDGRWEEMEVTASEAGAIKAGRTYVVGFQVTRWWRTGDGGRWHWSHRATTVVALSQLSSEFLGEWQAQRWTRPYASAELPRTPRPGRATD
jgi:hypothetical protein